MSSDIIKTLKTEAEVLVFARVNGYDEGRTDIAIAEWREKQADTEEVVMDVVDIRVQTNTTTADEQLD